MQTNQILVFGFDETITKNTTLTIYIKYEGSDAASHNIEASTSNINGDDLAGNRHIGILSVTNDPNIIAHTFTNDDQDTDYIKIHSDNAKNILKIYLIACYYRQKN